MESKIISLYATQEEIKALKDIKWSANRCIHDDEYPATTKPALEMFVALSNKIIDAFDNG